MIVPPLLRDGDEVSRPQPLLSWPLPYHPGLPWPWSLHTPRATAFSPLFHSLSSANKDMVGGVPLRYENPQKHTCLV